MKSFVDLCYGVLFSPRQTFRQIGESPAVGAAVLIVVLVNLLQGAFNSLAGRTANMSSLNSLKPGLAEEIGPLLNAVNTPGFKLMAVVMGLIFALLWWVTKSSLLHLIAEMLGGQGTGKGVLTVLGAAQLPAVLLIPVNVLLFSSDGASALAGGLAGLLAFAVWVYTALVLPVLGISEVHRFSTLRGAVTVLAPMLVLIVIMTIFFGLMVGFLAQVAPLIT
ncbi:MAG TPA: YIP1 family protein [Bacillota bacterium]|nr:YIP1 family protein [Bacillota bacterium]